VAAAGLFASVVDVSKGDGGPLAGSVDAGIGFEIRDGVFDVADVKAGVDADPVAFWEVPVGGGGIDPEEGPKGSGKPEGATAGGEELVASDHGSKLA